MGGRPIDKLNLVHNVIFTKKTHIQLSTCSYLPAVTPPGQVIVCVICIMYVSGKQGKGHNLTFSIGSGTAVLYMFSQLTGRLCSDQKSSQKTKIGTTR